MKKILNLCFVILVLAAASVCFADSAVTNGELVLSIPEDYEELLIIETPENSADGILFSVTEKESVEVAKAQSDQWDGAGWLFSIGTVSEERLHELLCNDMSGMKPFARDEAGNYYLLYHPTDVRMFREDYSAPDVMANWTMLNEWAASVPETFIADNAGLTAESHGNTELDIYLARLMYMDDVEYTVSTLEFGPLEPNGISAADYIAPLVNGVVYEPADETEAPDGEYVVLNFPADDCRFDFFFQEGKQNIIRQVWFNGENEKLYIAVFEDESITATEVMHSFYQAIAEAASL